MRQAIVSLLSLCLGWPLVAAAQTGANAAALREDQAAYLARCQRETVAQWPRAAAQAEAICRSKWDQITATGPLAEAMLGLAPAPGATFNPAGVPAQMASVRWRTRAAKGMAASGRLGELDVNVTRTPAPGVHFEWFKNGEPIPFDLEGALAVRGATLALIGCQSYGAAEGSRVYRVSAPGKAPFALSINFRSAAVASQSSSYAAAADFSARLPSLATLRRDGSEWAAACP